MNQSNFPDRRRIKQAEAKTRQAAWTLLSPEQKLQNLSRRPGASKKERARIIKHVEAAKAVEKEKK